MSWLSTRNLTWHSWPWPLIWSAFRTSQWTSNQYTQTKVDSSIRPFRNSMETNAPSSSPNFKTNSHRRVWISFSELHTITLDHSFLLHGSYVNARRSAKELCFPLMGRRKRLYIAGGTHIISIIILLLSTPIDGAKNKLHTYYHDTIWSSLSVCLEWRRTWRIWTGVLIVDLNKSIMIQGIKREKERRRREGMWEKGNSCRVFHYVRRQLLWALVAYLPSSTWHRQKQTRKIQIAIINWCALHTQQWETSTFETGFRTFCRPFLLIRNTHNIIPFTLLLLSLLLPLLVREWQLSAGYLRCEKIEKRKKENDKDARRIPLCIPPVWAEQSWERQRNINTSPRATHTDVKAFPQK